MGAVEKIPSLQIVDRLHELPTLPSIVYEISRVISDPMSSTSDLEDIMRNDPSLTAKVLKLANSAYYAIPGGATTLRRAIAYIGYDAIQQLVLSTSIINALDSKASQHFDPPMFWKHSLGVAMAAEATAQFVHHKNPSDLFTCGLVHDIGKIALYLIVPDLFAETLAAAKENGWSFIEAEERLEMPKHTVIGRELAAKWKLPPPLQAVTAYHHQKEAVRRGGLSPEMHLVVDIVLLSNILIHALQFGNSGHSKIVGVPKDVAERLQLDSEKLKVLVGKVKLSISNADNFLNIIGV
jgi:putative nucleotidyltransferase with HDIG domain